MHARQNADAAIADIVLVAVVEEILAAERGAGRQVVGVREGDDVARRFQRPAAQSTGSWTPEVSG